MFKMVIFVRNYSFFVKIQGESVSIFFSVVTIRPF